MAIQSLKVKFEGFSPLLQNNPQTVDPLSKYAQMKKPLTSKNKKTDEDILEIRRIEVESKVFWDDKIGIFVPTRWVLAAVAQNSYKIAKISKATARGAIFATYDKAKLTYSGMRNVKKLIDIPRNERFVRLLNLPQKGVRLAKAFPIFENWSFEVELEYDDGVVNKSSLVDILNYSARYGGFGDLRPSYGRCNMEVLDDE
jgi:hypothetical protein